MFDIGFGEMVLLAAIALIAIGPKQLPEVARTAGKFMAEFKKLLGEVSTTVATARDETNKTIHEIQDDVMKKVTTPVGSVPVDSAQVSSPSGAHGTATPSPAAESEQLAFPTEEKKPDGST